MDIINSRLILEELEQTNHILLSLGAIAVIGFVVYMLYRFGGDK